MIKYNRVLLVEDDEFKCNDIASLVEELLPSIELKIAGDVGSGIAEILNARFDLILLDIALPSRRLTPGGGTTSSLLSGGVEIIYRLEEDQRSDPVVIITQYPDIEIEGEQVPVRKIASHPAYYFEANILGCVRYEREKKGTWVEAIKKIITEVK